MGWGGEGWGVGGHVHEAWSERGRGRLRRARAHSSQGHRTRPQTAAGRGSSQAAGWQRCCCVDSPPGAAASFQCCPPTYGEREAGREVAVGEGVAAGGGERGGQGAAKVPNSELGGVKWGRVQQRRVHLQGARVQPAWAARQVHASSGARGRHLAVGRKARQHWRRWRQRPAQSGYPSGGCWQATPYAWEGTGWAMAKARQLGHAPAALVGSRADSSPAGLPTAPASRSRAAPDAPCGCCSAVRGRSWQWSSKCRCRPSGPPWWR